MFYKYIKVAYCCHKAGYVCVCMSAYISVYLSIQSPYNYFKGLFEHPVWSLVPWRWTVEKMDVHMDGFKVTTQTGATSGFLSCFVFLSRLHAQQGAPCGA